MTTVRIAAAQTVEFREDVEAALNCVADVAARAKLFQPFQGSTRSGGAGLGLVIAEELVRAHGGDITLVDGTIGATFHVKIPDRPIPLHRRRSERAQV